MKKYKVGFTGTRKGMTPKQKAALAEQMALVKVAEFHHGAAVGADSEADLIVRSKNLASIIKKHPVKKYGGDPLYRNEVIVESVDAMIAMPKGLKEEIRSGTWMTIRYAKKRKKPLLIIYPDGSKAMLNRVEKKGD